MTRNQSCALLKVLEKHHWMRSSRECEWFNLKRESFPPQWHIPRHHIPGLEVSSGTICPNPDRLVPMSARGWGSQWVYSTDCLEKFEDVPIQAEWDHPVVIFPLLHLCIWGYCSHSSRVREQLWNLWAMYQFPHNMGIDGRQGHFDTLSI